MKYKLRFSLFISFLCFHLSYGQNISVNTTGAANSTASMFEVLQPAGAADNSIGIFSRHAGTATNAYAIWAEATGAANKYAIVVPDGSGYVGIGTSTPIWPLDIAYTINSTTMNARGATIHPSFTSSGDGPGGLSSQPLFTPTANLSVAYGLIGIGVANPPAGITISNVNSGQFRFDTKAGSAGSVTNANVIQVASPSISGITPTNIYGINIANQGLAGMTNSYGLYVSAQTGATNSYAAIFNGGNVGISTTTPAYKVDISLADGDGIRMSPTLHATFDANAYENVMRPLSTNSTQGSNKPNATTFLQGLSAGTSYGSFQVLGNSSNSDPLIYWRTEAINSGAWNPWLQLVSYNSAGNVGIGTITPGSILQVRDLRAAVSNISNAGAVLVSATNNGGNTPNAPETALALVRNGVSGQSWENVVHFALSHYNVVSNNSTTQMDINMTGQANDNSTATNVMSLRSNGNVGIGTTAPTSKLSVGTDLAGTAMSSSFKTNAGALGGAAGNELSLASIGFVSGNQSALGIRAYRTAAGASWVTTSIGLGMDVDNTVRAGASLWLCYNGNVGIGTTVPGAGLDVVYGGVVSSCASKILHSGTAAVNPGTALRVSNGYPAAGGNYEVFGVYGNSFGTNYFTVMDHGRVGIGTMIPTALLSVNGNADNSTGVWGFFSDRRLKKDIEPLQHALTTVQQLQGVTFHWIDSKKDSTYGRVRGFIAQDIEKVIPEWVKTKSNGYKQLETIGMDALLVEAIKEQQKIIDSQKKEIENMKKEFATFKEIVKTLQLQIHSTAKK